MRKSKKKLNLHIGFHKTGTTSIQNYLHDNRSDSFRYLGKCRKQPENDALVDALSTATVLNDQTEITKQVHRLLEIIEEDEFNNFIISHERFLRPMASAKSGLSFLNEMISIELDVKYFVSTRKTEELLISRFLHDLKTFGVRLGSRVWKLDILPPIVLPTLFRLSLTQTGECSYPLCIREHTQCSCRLIKKNIFGFYKKSTIEAILGSEKTFFLNVFEPDFSISPAWINFLHEDDKMPGELPRDNTGNASIPLKTRKKWRKSRKNF